MWSIFPSVYYCCFSVTKSCLTLCDAMDCSMPGFPVPHYLPRLAQTHVHWVNNAIQSSHPLLPPSPPALNLSQHQGLFQWISSLHQVAKLQSIRASASVLPWIFKIDFLSDWLVWSPCCPGNSQETSLAPQFESINSLLFNLLYCPTLIFIHDYLKNHTFD